MDKDLWHTQSLIQMTNQLLLLKEKKKKNLIHNIFFYSVYYSH